MKKNKLHSIEISRTKWKLIVWTPIILGAIIWTISSTVLSLIEGTSLTRGLLLAGLTAGGILIGIGFGFACARIFILL